MANYITREEDHGKTDASGWDDPGLWDHLHVQTFADARHNYLIEVGHDGNLVPEVGESYESADGMTRVFKIRQGFSLHC